MTKVKDVPGCQGKQDLDSYCAGFFDGEGCVSIYRRKKNARYVQVIVSAYQTLEKPLQLLQKRFGGKVVPNKKRPRRKQSWTWYAYGKEAFFALSRMLPWLIVKRQKAKRAIAVLKYQPLKGEHISDWRLRTINAILGRWPV